MKKATFLAGLSVYYFPDSKKWVLTQKQAAGGKLQEVFAASSKRPKVAVELGVDGAIENTITFDTGHEVNPADHELISAWLHGDN